MLSKCRAPVATIGGSGAVALRKPLDAVHGLDDLLVGGRIADPNVAGAGGSEGGARHHADALFLARSFAVKAREAGIDKDPIVQRRLVQAHDSLLADLYLQQVEKNATVPNLEARARELYNGDPARFTSPEQVYIQHILGGPQPVGPMLVRH